jgi:hypothetical protein
LQKYLSTETIKLPQRIWWHRLPACADKGLNLKDISLIFFHKEHLGKLRVINAAPAFNTLLNRLESLCHQPKMNSEGAFFGNSTI